MLVGLTENYNWKKKSIILFHVSPVSILMYPRYGLECMSRMYYYDIFESRLNRRSSYFQFLKGSFQARKKRCIVD